MAKRIRFTAEELEVIASALAIWEASAPGDEESAGDIPYEEAKRLTPACESAANKIATLRGRAS